MSGGGKLPCGRPVSDVCTPKTSPTNNFPRTHLKANSHVVPYCNRKAILRLRNPCKSMKVLTLRAESPHLKTRLLSLKPWTDAGHTFNPIWENADSELESLLVLVYVLQVQRSEEISQPKTTRPFSSGTSLHPSCRFSFCGTPFPRTPQLPAALQESHPAVPSPGGSKGDPRRPPLPVRSPPDREENPRWSPRRRGGAMRAGAVAARLGRGGAQLHT